MPIRSFLALLAVGAMTACAPQVPNSGVGAQPIVTPGFELGAATTAATLPPPAPVATAPLGATGQAVSSADLAAAGIGVAPASAPVPQPITGLAQSTAQDAGPPLSALGAPRVATTPTAANPLGISDENDFNAVSSRESIESDAIRRAQLAAQRQEVAPTAVPQRPSDTGPNIVAFALQAPNLKGQPWYSRSLFQSQSRFQRNCARYASPDAAQRDFLARGGPERNPLGLDPDGDGFACGWDPAPFRLAAGGN